MDLPLCGGVSPRVLSAGDQRTVVPLSAACGVSPEAFVGVKPRVVVKAGESVSVGTPLFVDKGCESLRCVSPVSGVVSAIVRGDRRKVLSIRITPDTQQRYVSFGKQKVSALTADAVRQLLIDTGLAMYICQLPYAVVATPTDTPKGIFISALRDMPLECPFEEELYGQEDAWQCGLTALSKIAKVYVGIGADQTSAALTDAKDAEVTVFAGKCPAGNVGVQVNHLAPVNKGEVVWTVDPTVVLFLGRVLLTGELDFRRTIAIAGSEVTKPEYADVTVGTAVMDIVRSRVNDLSVCRVIDGNVLTGVKASDDSFLGPHTSCVTVIPEGSTRDELLGWILPRVNDFSVSRSYFSWLCPKRRYALDARVKGGRRNIIMSGEYDRVLPMDIYGEYLIKALLSGNIDRQEALGIYEVSPADFAVAEFVCSSKLPLQKIVREGLDILRKENA